MGLPGSASPLPRTLRLTDSMSMMGQRDLLWLILFRTDKGWPLGRKGKAEVGVGGVRYTLYVVFFFIFTC